MNSIVQRPELLLAFVPLLPVLYIALYGTLRLCGTLRVNRDGWLAGIVRFGGGTALTAWFLFDFFQPLLRLESSLRRRLALSRREKEPVVSEVVVEVIPMA